MCILKNVKLHYGLITLLGIFSCTQWKEESDFCFPLENGRYWIYSSEESEEKWSVIGDTIIEGIEFKIVLQGIDITFLNNDNGLSRYIKKDTIEFGEKKEIAKGFIRLIDLPLYKNKEWSDTLYDENGNIAYILKAHVDGMEELETGEAWCISYQEIIKIDTFKFTYWFKNNTGIVQRNESGAFWKLIETGIE